MPSLQLLLRRRFSASQTHVSPRGSATLSQKCSIQRPKFAVSKSPIEDATLNGMRQFD